LALVYRQVSVKGCCRVWCLESADEAAQC